MAIHPDIRDQAYQFFIEETPDLLQAIETGLLTLSQNRSTANVHQLMRTAHSLKGGSASVGLDAIATLAHRLENIFKIFYDESIPISTQLESQLLRAYDCLRLPLIQQIRTGAFDAEEALAIADPVFSQIEDQFRDALAEAENYVPTSDDLGVDMVLSIFEIDVAQGLKHLSQVVAQPQIYEVGGELRAQVEVFAGFAEILNLKGFGAIAEATRVALDRHPHQALAIAKLALQDFEQVRQAVLAGDRTSSLGPSADLIALASAEGPPAVELTREQPEFEVEGTSRLMDELAEAEVETVETFRHLFDAFDESGDLIDFAADGDAGDHAGGDADVQAIDQFLIDLSELEMQQPDAAAAEERVLADVAEPLLPESLDESLDGSWGESNGDRWLDDLLIYSDPSEPLNGGSNDAKETQETEQLILTAEHLFEELLTSSEPTHSELRSYTELSPESDVSETTKLSHLSEETLFSEDTFFKIKHGSGEAAPPKKRLPGTEPLSPANPDPEADPPTITIDVQATSDDVDLRQTSQPASSIIPANRADLGRASNVRQSVQSAASPQPSNAKTNLQSRQPQNGKAAAKTSVINPAFTVRVDSDRLERMNNLVGELAINRESLALQNDQLQGVLRELLKRFSRFQTMVSGLREVSDQMLVAPERYGYGSNGSSASTNGKADAQTNTASRSFIGSYLSGSPGFSVPEFDPLEMDRYGGLHSQMQGILEDLVQLEETVEDISLFARQSDQSLEKQRYMLIHLRDELIWARMLPMGEILNRFPRVLRDLSATYDKPANLRLVGTGVLIDKGILEKLYDPLLHLLRNAFDHGIEPPTLRRQRGKSEEGNIEIRAFHKGNQTIIEVTDDGQGVSTERIRNRLVELGWASAEAAAAMAPEQLFEFIFQPGFSTARQVNELSGRGVGLDVVRLQLQSIKGSITVSSIPGQGATFTLYLPLTLTIAKLITCLVGPIALALPSDSIEEILTPHRDQVSQSGEQRFLSWKTKIIPVYRLVDLLEYKCPISENSVSKALVAVSTPKDWALPMLIFQREREVFALEVDRLVNEQELVVKPFGGAIAPPPYAYGSVILGDGSLVPVVDAVALLNFRKEEKSAPEEVKAASKTSALVPLPKRMLSQSPTRTMHTPTILVVDDAVTIRRTLSLSLSRSGFRVLQARDGREALEQLQQSASVKLVICDVEMPNMNGFEFLTHRRQDPAIAKIPIIMLTSRSNDKHRWLANQLGATAYFTKPYLEHEFLSAVKELMDAPQDIPVASR